MASQRHKLVEQNSTAAGEIHAEGEVARSVINQVIPDPSNLNVLKEAEQQDGGADLIVPVGPAGGPLQGSSMSGAIPEDVVVIEAPVLTGLDPISAVMETGDVALTITGTGFTSSSVLVWNGTDDTADYVDETTMTTTVKTDLSTIPVDCEVQVRNGPFVSNTLVFSITEAVEESGGETERILPAGPFTLSRIDDDPDGLALTVDGSPDIRVGDTLLIEATGNTSVNGEYAVINIDPLVVDNPYELAAPIEAKGRVTIV